MRTLRSFLPLAAATLAILASAPVAAIAQESGAGSRCLAMAQAAPQTLRVSYRAAPGGEPWLIPAQGGEATTIRYLGHSTFLLTSPGGVTIATDYNGTHMPPAPPRIATMNRAHRTHWTPTPDPAIEHVLRGWTDDGSPAAHNLQVDDVLVRNVTTDIRGGAFGRLPDGNSIFIFETGGLCIGHLGHLHHVLEAADLGWIGQLDIVMVPVDGGYTMEQAAMVATLEVLKARLILPMHYFGQDTLARFLGQLDDSFEVATHSGPEIAVSPATLPRSPQVLVLPPY